MLKTKHTKGPWVAHRGIDYCQVSAPDGLVHTVSHADDESEANARLIAAAPELLAACYHAETVMMIVMPRSDIAEYRETRRELTAAIRKATVTA